MHRPTCIFRIYSDYTIQAVRFCRFPHSKHQTEQGKRGVERGLAREAGATEKARQCLSPLPALLVQQPPKAISCSDGAKGGFLPFQRQPGGCGHGRSLPRQLRGKRKAHEIRGKATGSPNAPSGQATREEDRGLSPPAVGLSRVGISHQPSCTGYLNGHMGSRAFKVTKEEVVHNQCIRWRSAGGSVTSPFLNPFPSW